MTDADEDATTAASDPSPNPAQQRLVDATEGIYVVDAGAGTGKTFAITRRYAEIVAQDGVEPEDVLLVTFTTSAATEMKERIVAHSDYSLRDLADAPIQTFHAHCLDLLREHGHRAPTHLGIDDRITDATRLVEDDLVKRSLFEECLDGFRESHPEFADQFRALDDAGDLLGVIEELAAKGVFPTTEGWYRDGEAVVEGDLDAFRDLFEDVNQPRNDGRKQSVLRETLGRYGRDRTYVPDAPAKAELRGEGTKRVPDATARLAFEQDRTDLQQFVHDVYVAYLEFALSRNYLTFGLLQLFAFVALCEDRDLRERAGFEYVMVDEFQDTSEIQFQLALLLAETDNLCAVGDWKQSIYGFQYADVENIRSFEDRIASMAAALNDDQERVAFDTDDVERIELTENYRSTQSILDFSEEALVAPATSAEEIDAADAERIQADVVSLSANATIEDSRIEGVSHPDECEAVLTAVQEIVGNEEYAVEADGSGAAEAGTPRPPEYGDVAVLTRTRDFGRELRAVAESHDVPVAYDGGIELFRTDQAKLLLAWLRILESDADRGWAPVLERAGYTLDEIADLLDARDLPENVCAFRDRLAGLEAIGAVARRVFDRYGFTGEVADVLLDAIQSMHDGSTLTRGDLIGLIERGIETGSVHEVSTGAGVDSITVQTIHAAKGLEYPIVVLANMNEGRFPPRSGGSPVVSYEEPVGLRQRKTYADVETHPHVYDEWSHDVLRHCLPDAHDEERRLLYVAITRAEQHVVFAGGESPNAFFEALPFEDRAIDPDVRPVERGETTQAQLPLSVVPPDGPEGLAAHDLLDDAVFEDGGIERETDALRGVDFGSQVHVFAEDYAHEVVDRSDASNDDERRVVQFLDGLDDTDGDLTVEVQIVLPLSVDGEQVTITGFVDLVHETPDAVDIYDYKTDRSRRARAEYRTQLSVYYHVLDAWYPERSVTASIVWTDDGERDRIDPLPVDALATLARERS